MQKKNTGLLLLKLQFIDISTWRQLLHNFEWMVFLFYALAILNFFRNLLTSCSNMTFFKLKSLISIFPWYLHWLYVHVYIIQEFRLRSLISFCVFEYHASSSEHNLECIFICGVLFIPKCISASISYFVWNGRTLWIDY